MSVDQGHRAKKETPAKGRGFRKQHKSVTLFPPCEVFFPHKNNIAQRTGTVPVVPGSVAKPSISSYITIVQLLTQRAGHLTHTPKACSLSGLFLCDINAFAAVLS